MDHDRNSRRSTYGSEKMEDALKWYQEQSDAMFRYNLTGNMGATMAVVTALSLDGGRRAREALEAWKREQ